MKLTTMKGFVATEPFNETEIKTGVKTIGGSVKLDTISALTSLSKLRVVFECEELGLKEGDSVFVESKQGITPWAKNRLQILDKTFILVPAQNVIIKES